jgi:LmbE family N-acetylglucosaminyl deacetylase
MTEKLYLFISPHLDDAVLSCGGLIKRLSATGSEVVVLTVATADIPEDTPLSGQMKWRYVIWRVGNKPFAQRRREDVDAVKILGAKTIHWDLLDAIFRVDIDKKPLYPDGNLNVTIHDYDRQNLDPILCDKLRKLNDDLGNKELFVFCPLGIGGHVDHQIVRTAVDKVYKPTKLIYYEDFPYVSKSNGLESLNKLVKNDDIWEQKILGLSENEIESRILAVACYSSQIPILFPSKYQHIQNRLAFYFPQLGDFVVRPINNKGSYQRISIAMKSYISLIGGERYWSHSIEPINSLI